MKQILLSKLRASTVFNVDRLTIYNWIRNGCPVVDLGQPGKPVQLDFHAVLSWRKTDLTHKAWGTDEYIKKMEVETRQRLRAFKK